MDVSKLLIALLVLNIAVSLVNTAILLAPRNETKPQPQILSETGEVQEWRNDCSKSTEGYDAVFIYMSTCPYSRRMKPLVENASDELKWYWINVRDPACASLNLTEFKYKGFVPHFYCLKTGEERTGAMSETDFYEWVNNCK